MWNCNKPTAKCPDRRSIWLAFSLKKKKLTNEDTCKYILLNFIFMLGIVNKVAIFFYQNMLLKVKIFILHCNILLHFIVIWKLQLSKYEQIVIEGMSNQLFFHHACLLSLNTPSTTKLLRFSCNKESQNVISTYVHVCEQRTTLCKAQSL